MKVVISIVCYSVKFLFTLDVCVNLYMAVKGSACGVMVIKIENRHGDLRSNPGWGCFYFILC